VVTVASTAPTPANGYTPFFGLPEKWEVPYSSIPAGAPSDLTAGAFFGAMAEAVHRGEHNTTFADEYNERLSATRDEAAKRGASRLILFSAYGHGLETEGTALSPLNWLIIPMFMVPTERMPVHGEARAWLIDVQTGRTLAATTASADDAELSPLAYVDRLRAAWHIRQRAAAEACGKLFSKSASTAPS
jgi:hypothetical protein